MTRTEQSNSASDSSASSVSASSAKKTDLHTPSLIASFVASTAVVGWASGLAPYPSQTSMLLGAGAVALSLIATVGRRPIDAILGGLRVAFGNAMSTVASMASSALSASSPAVVGDEGNPLVIGQYTLGEKIGQGGMGEVYRARHSMMDRDVAVKILPIDHADAEGCRRFEREVLMTSHLESPNTVAIYDYGRTPDGRFYYVMEHIDGYDLERLVRKFGAQSASRTVHILRQICGALGEAHSAGLVHRDVKPSNLALCERAGVMDVVKVLDFGLVEELDEDGDDYGDPESADSDSHPHSHSHSQSRSPSLTGTPAYLAPESILEPGVIDPRADIYALGAVAYWLLTGTNVFDGNSIVEICSHHLHTAPEALSDRVGSVPADLEAVVLRCLAKNPDDRFASMEELCDALDACECANEWTNEAAESWWLANEPESLTSSEEEQGPKSSGSSSSRSSSSRSSSSRSSSSRSSSSRSSSRSSSSRSNRFRPRRSRSSVRPSQSTPSSRPSSSSSSSSSSSGTLTGLTSKLASKLLGCILSPQG